MPSRPAVREQLLLKMIALVLLMVAAVAMLKPTPASALRNFVLPLGCNKEYIRQMVLSNCNRYQRGQRSAPGSDELGEGVGTGIQGVLKDSWGLSDEGMRDPRAPLSRRRPFLGAHDGLPPAEVLELAESEGDVQRLSRAEKSLLKCCFKGCSEKDFVGVC